MSRTPLWALCLTACALTPGQDREDPSGLGMPDFIPCDDTPATLSDGDVLAWGVTAADVVAIAAGPTTSPAVWTASGSPVDVTVSVTAAGAAIWHDLEVAPDTGSWGAESQCADWLEVPVTLSLSTADGAFAESVSASLAAFDATAPSVSAPLDWAALAGTYTFTEIDPSEWDSVELSVGIQWNAGGERGQVDMSASREVGGGMGEGMVGPVLRWPR